MARSIHLSLFYWAIILNCFFDRAKIKPTVVFAQGGVVIALGIAVAVTEAVSVGDLADLRLVVVVIGIAASVPLRPAQLRELVFVARLGAAVAAIPLALGRVECTLVVADAVPYLTAISRTGVGVPAVLPRRADAQASARADFRARVLATVSAVPVAPLTDNARAVCRQM